MQPSLPALPNCLLTNRLAGGTVCETHSTMSNASQEKTGGFRTMFSIRQRALAEVFGTAALVLVGPGSVIATLTLAGKAVPAVTEADLLGISLASGFIMRAPVYALPTRHFCHINPRVPQR